MVINLLMGAGVCIQVARSQDSKMRFEPMLRGLSANRHIYTHCVNSNTYK
jgi:hypothetical protein